MSFAAPPAVRGDVAIFSGTALSEFLRFRLGRDLACPFAGYRFGHPGTRWYNIASRLGMRAHFPGNADQVLDFFAGLVSRRLGEGRRPLLIAKKRFVGLCAAGLRRRLGEYHPSPVEIVTGDWDTIDLMRPDVIPLINFGMIGTNLFECFDCAYCLTGFYVNPEIVDTILQDVLASDGHLPIAIATEGSPRRRRARVADPRQRIYDVDRLAQYALDQQELDVVLQAVGRVRPYTRPREVVTFQCAGAPAAGLRPRVRLHRGGPAVLRNPHASRTGAGLERRACPGRTTGGDDAASGGGSTPAGAIDHQTVLGVPIATEQKTTIFTGTDVQKAGGAVAGGSDSTPPRPRTGTSRTG